MKKGKRKITKDIVPEGFTLSLAIVDFIPVFFFILAVLIFSYKIYFDYLIVLGVLICFISGFIKVLWKIIVVLQKRNVWWMFVQMRIFMTVGFSIFTLGFILGWKNFSDYFYNASFYFRIFLTLWIIGMSLMFLFAIILDSSDPLANWIEQITNSISQILLCIGVYLM